MNSGLLFKLIRTRAVGCHKVFKRAQILPRIADVCSTLYTRSSHRYGTERPIDSRIHESTAGKYKILSSWVDSAPYRTTESHSTQTSRKYHPSVVVHFTKCVVTEGQTLKGRANGKLFSGMCVDSVGIEYLWTSSAVYNKSKDATSTSLSRGTAISVRI